MYPKDSSLRDNITNNLKDNKDPKITYTTMNQANTNNLPTKREGEMDLRTGTSDNIDHKNYNLLMSS